MTRSLVSIKGPHLVVRRLASLHEKMNSVTSQVGQHSSPKYGAGTPSTSVSSTDLSPGSHSSEAAVNKQLNDKERVAAALKETREQVAGHRAVAALGIHQDLRERHAGDVFTGLVVDDANFFALVDELESAEHLDRHDRAHGQRAAADLHHVERVVVAAPHHKYIVPRVLKVCVHDEHVRHLAVQVPCGVGVIDRGLELLGLAGNALGDSRGKALQTRGGSEEQPSRRFSKVNRRRK